ncbi:SWIM zinc finger protein [Stagonosporopsis vannaccii]|nr:SWIM zinc finger protein [Stagonosporopsis vannaccii]
MDSATLPRTRPTRKRKAAMSYVDCSETEFQNDDQLLMKKPKKPAMPPESGAGEDAPEKTRERKTRSGSAVPPEEKRLRRHRAHAPNSYVEVKNRALTQRLTVLFRERYGTDELPEEKVVIAGSTGNVYTVNVGLEPRCDCPHAKKGNQCKHIVYIMLRVLKARENVAYQLALTGTELRELIKNAPLVPGVETGGNDRHGGQQDGNRKTIEGECPICYDELNIENDEIVYCKASCGNNVHKACMQSWIQVATSGRATCPYCRAPWDIDAAFEGRLDNVDVNGLRRNEDGYLNVAGQLGLSGVRDYSSYHQFWVRRHVERR